MRTPDTLRLPLRLPLTAALLTATALAGMTKPADSMTPPGTAAKPGMAAKAYQPYTKAAFDAARGKQRVLFFHATWCPNCRAADADLLKNAGTLPADVMVFKTDYDKETALKRQYGITSQHSFVLVDATGKALKKWAGGATREIVAATRKM